MFLFTFIAKRYLDALAKGDYVLKRNTNYTKYNSLYKCFDSFIERYNPEEPNTLISEFKEKYLNNFKNMNQSSMLKDPLKQLTEDEMLSIYFYTTNAHENIMEFLRAGTPGPYECYMDFFYSAIAKLKYASPELELFSGVSNINSLNSMKIFDDNGEYIGEGTKIAANGITSSSMDITQAFMRAYGTQVIIKIVNPKNAHSIENISSFPNEKEYIIPPMVKYVLGKNTTKYCMIHKCTDTYFENSMKVTIIEANETSIDPVQWVTVPNIYEIRPASTKYQNNVFKTWTIGLGVFSGVLVIVIVILIIIVCRRRGIEGLSTSNLIPS